jgi:hypothetical protein
MRLFWLARLDDAAMGCAARCRDAPVVGAKVKVGDVATLFGECEFQGVSR